MNWSNGGRVDESPSSLTLRFIRCATGAAKTAGHAALSVLQPLAELTQVNVEGSVFCCPTLIGIHPRDACSAARLCRIVRPPINLRSEVAYDQIFSKPNPADVSMDLPLLHSMWLFWLATWHNIHRWLSTSFLFMAEKYSIVWIYHLLIDHQLIDVWVVPTFGYYE